MKNHIDIYDRKIEVKLLGEQRGMMGVRRGEAGRAETTGEIGSAYHVHLHDFSIIVFNFIS